MTYDRADWHSGGDFPEELSYEHGATHIGMYLAWAILNGLEGGFLNDNFSESLQAVRERRMTGAEFLLQECDGKFWDEHLSPEGDEFTKLYYAKRYSNDYASTFVDQPSVYHVADTWENYERIGEKIDSEYQHWKDRGKLRSQWWKFWS